MSDWALDFMQEDILIIYHVNQLRHTSVHFCTCLHHSFTSYTCTMLMWLEILLHHMLHCATKF